MVVKYVCILNASGYLTEKINNGFVFLCFFETSRIAVTVSYP